MSLFPSLVEDVLLCAHLDRTAQIVRVGVAVAQLCCCVVVNVDINT